MKQSSFVLRLILDWILVAAGVLGSMLCVITAFEFPIPDGFWLATLTAVSFDCCLLSGKRLSRIFAPILTGLLLAMCLLLRRELAESFHNLWGWIGSYYVKGYGQIMDFLPRDYLSAKAEAAGPALLVIALFMSLLVSMSVRWWKRSFPAALALLLGIAPCFILLDTPPALLPLLIAVGSVLVQVYSQAVRRREMGEENKAIGLSFLLAAGLLGLLLLLFPREKHEPPITWRQLTTKMDQWGEERRNRGNQLAGLSGNPDDVDLSALGALPNNASTVLQVKAEHTDYLYLRGSSYNVFDGTNWSRGEEKDWPQSALFPYLEDGVGFKADIITMEREPALYTTYQTTALPAGAEVVSDSYVRNNNERMYYTIRYRTAQDIREPDPDYDAWVQRVCTEIPDRTRQGVLDWWEAQGGLELEEWLRSGGPVANWQTITGPSDASIAVVFYDPSDPLGKDYLLAYAEEVAAKVAGCAKYSRNPLRVPEDRDFCTWFLTEAEEGYCVHFASSCTALLRALGVPARYVSGYVCPAEADRTVSVTNLQAHAWVEIWTGGRWVAVEPTPDNATEFTGEGVGVGGPSTPAPIETTEDPNIRPTRDRPLPTDPVLTEPSHTRPTREPSASTEPNGPGSGGTEEPRDLTALWIFLGVIGLLIAVLLRRFLARRLRERRLGRASGNDLARLLYRYTLRLHRLGGGQIPEEARNLAYKASFSQYELDAKEIYLLRQLYDQQVCRLGIAGPLKRFWCKYVLAVI